MVYQYKREPLSNAEADKLSNSCETPKEKLIVWTLLDTGLRASELANLKKENILWQEHRLVVFGKGGIYGKQSKRRVIPMTPRVQPLLENHFAMNNTFGMTRRGIHKAVKRVANRSGISKPVMPHVLRHTFSVRCINRGISLRSLQGLLGHDHITTTEIYMRMSPEDICKEFQDKF